MQKRFQTTGAQTMQASDYGIRYIILARLLQGIITYSSEKLERLCFESVTESGAALFFAQRQCNIKFRMTATQLDAIAHNTHGRVSKLRIRCYYSTVWLVRRLTVDIADKLRQIDMPQHLSNRKVLAIVIPVMIDLS